MKGLIQRVRNASVTVAGETVGNIGQGLLLLLAVEQQDDEERTRKLVHKVLHYRVFADTEGKMNRSLLDIRGELLMVSQFTLAADTRKGLRPSFTPAAKPDDAQALFSFAVSEARTSGLRVETGRFAADMQVSLVNDGPVTFWLES